MLTFGPIPEMEHSDGPIVLGKNGGIAVYRFGSVLAWGKATPVVSNVQMLLMTKNNMGMGQSLHRRVRDLPPFYGFLSYPVRRVFEVRVAFIATVGAVLYDAADLYGDKPEVLG